MSRKKLLQGSKFESSLNNISLGEFFFNYGEQFGSNICQIDATVNESETYFGVKKRSIRLSIALQRFGISSEDIVVTCAYNSLDTAIPIIATFYLGAKIANLDPTLSNRQIKHLLTLASPKVIFVEEICLGDIEKCLKEINQNPKIVVFGKSNEYFTFNNLVQQDSNEDKFEPTKVNIHETAIMFFSSGTTGLPKAICHSHYSFLQLTESAYHSQINMDCILSYTTYYWVSAMWILALTFLKGATRILSRNMDGENIFAIIEKYNVSTIFMAPIYTYNLTNVKNNQRYDTSSLSCILTGGTSMSPDQFKRLDQLFETTEIIFAYGMTEIGFISAFDFEKDKILIKNKIGSCGKVCAGVIVKLVDPDTNEILGPNAKGEICVKSSGLMTGYYNQDSSDCFDSDGFLKTGDLGYYDEDECLFVAGRLKEMFKYQSWHIVPSSIEAVILEHPAVKETVVFGIPRGEEGEIPAACVVLKDQFRVDNEEIEEFVKERVSDRENLRGGVTFVDSIPKTPSGKVMRKEFRDFILKSCLSDLP